MLDNSVALPIESDQPLTDYPLPPPLSRIDRTIETARHALVGLQHDDGYWAFELEADCTIPAEYILMMHYFGNVNEELQTKLCNYLRARQGADGGYPLFTGGEENISTTTKVYYALKLAGDCPEETHMVQARKFILAAGGAAKCNVFTRIELAKFQQIPWRGVPYIPVEIMLLPHWFPFHLDKVSYWSRVVMVPLFILCTLKAKAKNPNKVDILELFTTHPDQEQHYFTKRGWLNKCFLALDKLGRLTDPLIPKKMRQHAINKARDWFLERLNGEDGLGGIFPAMVNAYEALILLGVPADNPDVKIAKKAVDKLLVVREYDAYCQPCLSPVWDTALAALALQEVDQEQNSDAISRGLQWLQSKQLHDEPGDWRVNRPNLEGGGWAFEFENPHYPDVDDSAVVAFAMTQQEDPAFDETLRRAGVWIAGMQSKNGGFGAFDADNTHYYLNDIPFADHGALLDPPTVDVSARCLMFLSQLVDQKEPYQAVMDACLNYIRTDQEEDGSWFGRWGTNYIYGTWSVLVALETAQIPATDPMVQKAVHWLKSIQREDGGWGEDNASYHDKSYRGRYHLSTSFQTAWALLGLLAAGEVQSVEVKRGIDFLLRTQRHDGFWADNCFTAPGFPRVFYLKYHGYNKFFPLWALAKYRNLHTAT